MKASLNALHHHDSDWKRELDFYTEELAILSRRLAEFNSRYSAKKDKAKAALYQRKFVAMRKAIDRMNSDIAKREKKIEGKAMKAPGRIDERVKLANDKIFERMTGLAHKIAKERHEFNYFIAQMLSK